VSAVLVLATLAACGSPAPESPASETPRLDGGSGGNDAAAGDAGEPDATPVPLGPCPQPEEGLVGLEDAPLSAATDATHVYWVTSVMQRDGTYLREVRRALKVGGAPETLVSTPRDIAVVAARGGIAYWSEAGDVAGPASVRAWDASGVRTVATFDPQLGTLDPFAFAIDDARSYVLLRRAGAGGAFTYTVWTTPLSGGTNEAVAKNSLDLGGSVRALSVEGSDVFWGFSSGFLFRADRAGRSATATQVLNEMDGLDAWAVRATDVAFAQNGGLFSVSKTGGATTALPGILQIYRTMLQSPVGLVWGARSPSGVEEIRLLRRDSSVCTLATTDVKSVFSMATDGDKVFWTNTATRAAGGAVRWARLPK
jgi:hypothetical protein